MARPPLNPYLRLAQSVELMHDSLKGLGKHGATDREHKAAVRQTVVHLVAAATAMQEIVDNDVSGAG